MLTAAFYLIFGSTCLIVGVTGRGIRQDVEVGKAKKGRKVLIFCGAGLLIGALWEFLDIVL